MIERGRFGDVPFAAIGAGPPVVVLAGVSPTTGVDGDQFVRGSLAPVRRLAGPRRLVLLNRWPGMGADLTMADLARGHARALRDGFGEQPVDVLGMSTGGSIAQQLAADYPELVRRLVLLSTGCRLGPVGRRDQARVAELLRAGDLRGACRSAGADLLPSPLKPLGAAAGWLAAHRVLPTPCAADDLRATLEAEDGFDLARCSPIHAPTLIVAGARDRFYSPEIFHETQQLIPGSRLLIRPRRGHVTVTMDPKAQAAIADFFTS